jgi:riboflavin kinase / FMN adenylyltransferase
VTQLVTIDDLPASAGGGVISIGNFDGVHRGHAALLGRVCELARKLGGPSVAVILDPHPVSLLRPDVAPQRLTTIGRRLARLTELAVDFLVVCSIDRKFLNMSAEQFFQSLIVEKLRAKGIVEGPNFFFGHKRGGNVELLQAFCSAANIQCMIAGSIQRDEEMISSTRIRNALMSGDIALANELLGAPYQLEGIVGTGQQRGRKLGFPTANLDAIPTLVPKNGVYGGVTYIDGRVIPVAIHIGPNPTFETSDLCKVEVHLLDYSGDLYGQLLMVDFHTHVRDIARFDSPEQLAQQLTQDIQTIRDSLVTTVSRSKPVNI